MRNGLNGRTWGLATQPRVPESFMIDDEDEDHVPHKDIPESQDDEFARSVRVRDAARRAFIAVDTDQRLPRAPDRLIFEHGHLCYFWRDATGWSPSMATVVSQVGQGHCSVDYGGRIFKKLAEQLPHVTERERLAQDAVRESQDPGQNMNPVTVVQPEQPQQSSPSAEPAPNSAAPFPDRQPDVSMPDAQDSLEAPGDPVINVERSDSDREGREFGRPPSEPQLPSEPVPHSSSSNYGYPKTKCLLQSLVCLCHNQDGLPRDGNDSDRNSCHLSCFHWLERNCPE